MIPMQFQRRSRVSAFTLVEMLVAMALSLVIILAVTQVFRLVGDNVVASRAMLEMSGQLRSAADQLQRDLGGVTVSVRPWPETSSDAGYFEYYEGPFWDLGLGPAAAAPYTETSVGDIDDVLMFTARSTGMPFIGQVMASFDPTSDPAKPRLMIDSADPTHREVLESQVAEVVWFTRFNDRNRNRQPDAGELTLHRRVLLVLPNLDLTHPTIQAMSPLQFYSTFDLSVRTTQIDPSTWARLPNSLNDLARRENRIAHDVSGAYPTYGSLLTPNRPFPSLLWRALLVPQGSVVTPGANGAWGEVGVDDDGANGIDDVGEAGHFGTDDLTLIIDSPDVTGLLFPPPPFPTYPGRTACAESFGSDLVLTNLLAFDVQAYDPSVQVQRAVSGNDPVLPSDPGYRVLAGNHADVIGTGGYVDLFFARYVGVPSPFSEFSDRPLVRSGMQLATPTFWGQPPIVCLPAVYDTWSLSYEQDGLDQDGMWFGDTLGPDQGSNGIDDDPFTNGVDDVGERETSPPYPVPLRGIQVRMRIIDRDSRQVRQMTVSSDFVPE
jgi:type II secretory pathway pseudopilin PulG